MFCNPPKKQNVGTRLSGVFFHSKFDTACPNILLLMHWMLVGYSWHVLAWRLLEWYVFDISRQRYFFLQLWPNFWWKEQVQCSKLNMLICITNVSVVLPSSLGSISVVFPMFSMCLRSLHLFVCSFESVIQVHHVASIHLRRRHEHEKWKMDYVLLVEY